MISRFRAGMLHMATALCLALAATACPAQDWPSRPVRIVVPFPPGNGADVISRLIGERIAPALGQPVIVENRPGAGSMVGTTYVAKSAADGYTLLAGGNSAMVINPFLYKDAPYDTLRDFAPIVNISALPLALCVTPTLPVQNVRELIELAKRKPGAIAYGSSGNGSTHHLTTSLFAVAAGIQLTHVPYKGSSASFADLMAGRVQLVADTMPTAVLYARAGKVRAIGVTSLKRSPFLPDVPTLDEQGVKGFDIVAWTGLFAPAGTPEPILDRLNAEVLKVLKEPATLKRMHDLALDPIGNTREHFTAFVKQELVRWQKAVQASGAKID
jgi:tripartite-type tricarboxylate transporter receptor subunit TctC